MYSSILPSSLRINSYGQSFPSCITTVNSLGESPPSLRWIYVTFVMAGPLLRLGVWIRSLSLVLILSAAPPPLCPALLRARPSPGACAVWTRTLPGSPGNPTAGRTEPRAHTHPGLCAACGGRRSKPHLGTMSSERWVCFLCAKASQLGDCWPERCDVLGFSRYSPHLSPGDPYARPSRRVAGALRQSMGQWHVSGEVRHCLAGRDPCHCESPVDVPLRPWVDVHAWGHLGSHALAPEPWSASGVSTIEEYVSRWGSAFCWLSHESWRLSCTAVKRIHASLFLGARAIRQATSLPPGGGVFPEGTPLSQRAWAALLRMCAPLGLPGALAPEGPVPAPERPAPAPWCPRVPPWCPRVPPRHPRVPPHSWAHAAACWQYESSSGVLWAGCLLGRAGFVLSPPSSSRFNVLPDCLLIFYLGFFINIHTPDWSAVLRYPPCQV